MTESITHNRTDQSTKVTKKYLNQGREKQQRTIKTDQKRTNEDQG